MNCPNLFIVGAPKCGTTAVAQWLGEHPQIFMPPIKEPHFFSDDLNNRKVTTWKQYRRLFENTNASHQWLGDASVWYLSSKTAIPKIVHNAPSPKFLVCIRNPVEMAVSLHQQHLLVNNEDVAEFDEAWKLQSERQVGKQIPKLCVDPQLLMYGHVCKIGEQLERMYRWVPRRSVYPLFLVDIQSDPQTVYDNLMAFLELDNDLRRDFPVVNAASESRSAMLAKGLKSLNLMRRKMRVPRLGTGVLRFLNELNRAELKKKPHDGVSEQTRAYLRSYFAEDIRKIEYYTDRDLSFWDNRNE